MNYQEIKEISKLIQYEENCRRAREEFKKYGVKFFDKYGWGYIVKGVKKYVEKK